MDAQHTDWEIEAEVSLNHGVRVRPAVMRVYRDGEWRTVTEHTVRVYSPTKQADVVLAFGELAFVLALAGQLRKRLAAGAGADAVIEEYRNGNN